MQTKQLLSESALRIGRSRDGSLASREKSCLPLSKWGLRSLILLILVAAPAFAGKGGGYLGGIDDVTGRARPAHPSAGALEPNSGINRPRGLFIRFER